MRIRSGRSIRIVIEIIEERTNGLLVEVHFPQKRYIDEFIGLKCAPDLLVLGLFPNGKEITETMTAFNAIREYLRPHKYADRDVRLFDVGAGHQPRTAALFACRTAWQCFAIDPLLNVRPSLSKIERLQCFAGKLEDFPIQRCGLAVIAAVHAHVDLKIILERIQAERTIIVAMPCCQPLFFETIQPVEEYEDSGCWSPHRTVKIYDIIRGDL
jgi:hypothetical protein